MQRAPWRPRKAFAVATVGGFKLVLVGGLVWINETTPHVHSSEVVRLSSLSFFLSLFLSVSLSLSLNLILKVWGGFLFMFSYQGAASLIRPLFVYSPRYFIDDFCVLREAGRVIAHCSGLLMTWV